MNKRKFRKKPVVVEAYQTDRKIVVQATEGPLLASPGDWIITGVDGKQYPCKPDIFEKTYEPVNGTGQYRRKPVIIEAFQTPKELVIITLEGPLRAEPGDWIITGVTGEQYPCKPSIFEKIYEPVDEDLSSTAL